MLEISTSGLMSEDGKRSGLVRAQPPRPSSTLRICDQKAVSDADNLFGSLTLFLMPLS
jgi:hypothetical protein